MKTLLIVDDQQDLELLFRRFLRKQFDHIYFANSAAVADALLGENTITHLVMDARLPDTSSGNECIAVWRSKYSSIRFAGLFTGMSEFQNATIPGVDKIFLKPDGFDSLLNVLSAEE
jgi:response regulator RpfG family c-di-GMP phosphodiesterase